MRLFFVIENTGHAKSTLNESAFCHNSPILI